MQNTFDPSDPLNFQIFAILDKNVTIYTVLNNESSRIWAAFKCCVFQRKAVTNHAKPSGTIGTTLYTPA